MQSIVSGKGSVPGELVKTDRIGNLQWQKCYGGSNFEVGEVIIQDTLSNFIVLANTMSVDGDINANHSTSYDIWVLKIDSLGNLITQKCFGGSESDLGYSIFRSDYSGYIIAGSVFSNDGDVSGNHGVSKLDYWVMNIDSSLNLEWQMCYGGNENEYMSSVINSLEGGLIASGYSRSNDGDVSGHHSPVLYGDFWIAKLSEPYVGISEPKNQFIDLKCMIDQRENKLIINLRSMLDDQSELDLIDISGRIILKIQIDVKSGLNHFELDPGELSQGIYLVRIMGKSGSISGKLIAN